MTLSWGKNSRKPFEFTRSGAGALEQLNSLAIIGPARYSRNSVEAAPKGAMA
jgi:hypothetical protein